MEQKEAGPLEMSYVLILALAYVLSHWGINLKTERRYIFKVSFSSFMDMGNIKTYIFQFCDSQD